MGHSTRSHELECRLDRDARTEVEDNDEVNSMAASIRDDKVNNHQPDTMTKPNMWMIVGVSLRRKVSGSHLNCSEGRRNNYYRLIYNILCDLIQ